MIAPDIKSRLQAVGVADDPAIEIGSAALALSAAVSGIGNIEARQRHLEALADGVRGYVRGAEDTLARRAEALARILNAHYGYGSGDDDDAATDGDDDGLPDTACLATVIDRRRGSALTIGLLYLATARAVGWAAEGLDFPGRFLIRLDLGAERRIVDPHGGGRILNVPDLRALLKETSGTEAELSPTHYRPMQNRAILYRYLSDLKMRLLKTGRLEDALRAVEAMLLAAPGAAPLWREAGLMHARLDNVPAAVLALEHFLEIAVDDDGRYKALMLLTELRERLSN